MEKNQKKVLWIGLAIVLFFGAVLAASYHYERPATVSDIQNVPQTHEEIAPAVDPNGKNALPIIDESVENWKVYSDKQFGYEVKYPAGYVVYKYLSPCGSKHDDVNGQNVIIWNENFLSSHNISKSQITDFDIFINDPNDTCVQGHYSSPGGPGAKTYRLLDSQHIIMNGYAVLQRNYIDVVPDDTYPPFNFSTWRFEKGGTYYTLLYNNGISVDPEKQAVLFESFLQSFTFEVTEDDNWKKYISEGKPVFSTKNWESYSLKNDNLSFSIEYPADWIRIGSNIFEDVKGRKVAEFSPGLIVLEPNQKCFDTRKENSNRSELISQTDIAISEREGILRVEKTFYEGGGYWYPNIYCIMQGTKAFVMVFYEKELNPNKRDVHKTILSTLKFE